MSICQRIRAWLRERRSKRLRAVAMNLDPKTSAYLHLPSEQHTYSYFELINDEQSTEVK